MMNGDKPPPRSAQKCPELEANAANLQSSIFNLHTGRDLAGFDASSDDGDSLRHQAEKTLHKIYLVSSCPKLAMVGQAMICSRVETWIPNPINITPRLRQS